MYSIKYILSSFKFWINILSVWGVLWSISEGVLFSLQLAGITQSTTLGKYLLLLFLISIIWSIYQNLPFKQIECRLLKTKASIRVVFGDFWKQKGEKVIGVTRDFSSTVDNIVINEDTLHGQFIKRNFANNQEARLRLDSELKHLNESSPYLPGTTIKINGSKDTCFLVGVTILDAHYQASVKLDEYFTAISRMWEFISERNGAKSIICPLIGSGRTRLNTSAEAIFSELLQSAIVAMKSKYITRDLVFVVHPNDVISGKISIEKISEILKTHCNYENAERIQRTEIETKTV